MHAGNNSPVSYCYLRGYERKCLPINTLGDTPPFDSKSAEVDPSWGFESPLRHQLTSTTVSSLQVSEP